MAGQPPRLSRGLSSSDRRFFCTYVVIWRALFARRRGCALCSMRLRDPPRPACGWGFSSRLLAPILVSLRSSISVRPWVYS